MILNANPTTYTFAGMNGRKGEGPNRQYPIMTQIVPMYRAIQGEIHLSRSQPHNGEKAAYVAPSTVNMAPVATVVSWNVSSRKG